MNICALCFHTTSLKVGFGDLMPRRDEYMYIILLYIILGWFPSRRFFVFLRGLHSRIFSSHFDIFSIFDVRHFHIFRYIRIEFFSTFSLLKFAYANCITLEVYERENFLRECEIEIIYKKKYLQK